MATLSELRAKYKALTRDQELLLEIINGLSNVQVDTGDIILNVDDLEGNTERSVFEKMKAYADNLVKTFAYSDAGTVDERVTSITYTATLPAEFSGVTCTETFAYGGVSGAYYVTSITLAIT